MTLRASAPTVRCGTLMQDSKLTHALTTDRDFEQAGFQNALIAV